MRARGYTQTTVKHSAQYSTEFVRGTTKFTIDGWHGTGQRGTCRWFGDLKTIFTLYDDQYKYPDYVKATFSCLEIKDSYRPSQENFDMQKDVIDRIYKYLDEHA
jgi:hypothetical protein